MSNKKSSPGRDERPAAPPRYLHRAINAALCMSRRRRSRCLFELDKKEAARRAQNASIYCVISHGMANYGVNTFSHLSPGVSRARNKTPGRSISPLSFDKAQKRCKCE
jgi:hypothetical protein